MECVELSDVEEGEILEYEFCSPESTERDEEALRVNGIKVEEKEFKAQVFNYTKHKRGHETKDLKNKFSKRTLEKNNSKYELDDISSADEEFQSEVENSLREIYTNGETFKKRWKKESDHVTYGTVEDIMSEIGETISRKSRCNYKRRRSRDIKYSYNLISQNNSRTRDVRSRKLFSSHLKKKEGKWKKFKSNSDSEELSRSKRCKKKKKRKAIYHENVDNMYDYEKEETLTSKTKKKTVDFDEMRKNLLEKLKRQKAEEELQKLESTSQEMESSEIQEVEMIIDCTNYVDRDMDKETEKSKEVTTEEDEEELDLIKLRTMALASKERRRNSELQLAKADSTEEEISENKKTRDNNSRIEDDGDLDRHELLLRAEALRTALLKKHQKRLNRLKKEKQNDGESCGESTIPYPSSTDEGNVEQIESSSEKTNFELSSNLDKENFNEETGNKSTDVSEGSDFSVNIGGQKELSVESTGGTLKKLNLRTKIKKRKRKSISLENNLKENEQKEALEEDDKALRFQLLSDLIKKKSMKDKEKKSVLLDSVQMSENKPQMSSSVAKPGPFFQNNFLKKVNVNKTKKRNVGPPMPKVEIQRIVVQLGRGDSSDEGGGEGSDNQSWAPKKDDEDPELSTSEAISSNSTNQPEEVVDASCERSVELLLSRAREKIEGKLQKSTSILATPEAVYKHLPPSQRLEYIRLKQKIAERERLRNLKKEISSGATKLSENTLDPSKLPQSEKISTVMVTSPSRFENPPNGVKEYNKNLHIVRDSKNLNKVIANRKIMLPSSLNKSPLQKKTQNSFAVNSSSNSVKKTTAVKKSMTQNFLLLPANQTLIAKLKLLLKKIKIEKTIEENYDKEIGKLKNQLSLFEKKKSEQKFKIKKLADESMKVYKLLQSKESPKKKTEGIKNGEQKEIKTPNVVESVGKLSDKILVQRVEVATENGMENCEVQITEKPLETFTKENPSGTPEDINKEKQTENCIEQSGDNLIDKVGVNLEGIEVQDGPFRDIIKSGTSQEVNSGEESEKVSAAVAVGSSCGELAEYNSPLQTFNKASGESSRVDPNVIMCQFDLMGVCKDEECKYQHLRTS